MPELPEVETMCRGVRGIVGLQVQRVTRPACKCRPCLFQPQPTEMNRRLRGRRVLEIIRRGKRVILRFEGDEYLVVEPRMTGLVLLADPPDPDHLRLSINFSPCENRDVEAAAERTHLLVWDRRGLGTIRLLNAEEFQQQVEVRLGPDALRIDSEQLRDRLKASRRAIKVALLDQAVVAGIGNLYAAEILFLSGIDPRTRCDRLSRAQYQRVIDCTREVLHEAIAHEGSTLGDGTYRNALNDPGGYQNYHRVYDRESEPCGRCSDGTIQRIVQAQRSTFFCPKCQLRRGTHPSWNNMG